MNIHDAKKTRERERERERERKRRRREREILQTEIIYYIIKFAMLERVKKEATVRLRMKRGIELH